MEKRIASGHRVDDTGFGGLKLIQDPAAFCYGVDAVLLACFVEAKQEPVIVDLGTGNGILPILLSHRTDARKIIGVEIQEDACRLAEQSIDLNGLTDRVQIVHGDIRGIFEKLKKGSCDIVVTNPPYMKAQQGLINEKAAKAVARHETTANLSEFVNTAASLLRTGGSFYMIHRPQRLVDILVLCRECHLEPKQIRFVSPDRNKSPNLVLLQCVKGGRPALNFLEPLSIYHEDGTYTQEILQMYERI